LARVAERSRRYFEPSRAGQPSMVIFSPTCRLSMDQPLRRRMDGEFGECHDAMGIREAEFLYDTGYLAKLIIGVKKNRERAVRTGDPGHHNAQQRCVCGRIPHLPPIVS
jgi:hypothetical protein